MTTVVWDGHVLAADSVQSIGREIDQNPVKKIHLPGEGEYWSVHGIKVLALGMSGEGASIYWAKELLAQGIDHKTVIDHISRVYLSYLLVDENKECWNWIVDVDKRDGKDKGFAHIDYIGKIGTAGSGGRFARPLLSVGFGAVDAVMKACKLDPFSGGDVQMWVHPGKPEVPSKRPEVVKPKEEDEDKNNPTLTIPNKETFTKEELLKIAGEAYRKGKKVGTPDKAEQPVVEPTPATEAPVPTPA